MRRTKDFCSFDKRRSRWTVYIPYTDASTGRRQAYRRDAEIQTKAGVQAEVRRRLEWLAKYGTPYGPPIETGRPAPEVVIPTFAQFWTEQFVPTYLPGRARPSTIERYNDLYHQELGPTFGELRLDEISVARVGKFQAHLATKPHVVGGKVVDGVRVGGRVKKIGVQARPHLALLRSVFRAALELQVLKPEQVPAIRLPPKPATLPDAPSEADLEKLIRAADGYLRTMILLSALAGLRSGEARELRCRDVDLAHDRLYVRRALSADTVVPPKGAKHRVIPLHPALREALEPLVRGKGPDTLLCLNSKGRVPSRQAVLTAFKALCRRCGVREWSFHVGGRHAWTSALFRKGVGAETVRKLGGWSKLETVQRYAHASASDLEEAIGRLRHLG